MNALKLKLQQNKIANSKLRENCPIILV